MITRLVFLLALFFLFSAFVSFASAGAESSRLGAGSPGPVSAEAASGVRQGSVAIEHAAPASPENAVLRPVVYRGETEFPDDTALIVETGCWGCDGPTSALYRLSRSRGGPVHIDLLFKASGQGYITGFAMKPDASEMVVAVCSRLYCGGLGAADPGSEIAVYYSRDLGATWQDIGTSSHYYGPVALTGAGIVFVQFRPDNTAAYYLNSGDRVAPPARAEFVQQLSRRNGELSWTTDSGTVLDALGATLFTAAGAEYITGVATNPGQPLLAAWQATEGAFHLSALAFDGAEIELSLPQRSYAEPAAWLDKRYVVASVEVHALAADFKNFGMVPAIFDMKTGDVWSIAGFDVAPFGRTGMGGPAGEFVSRGRNRVQAVLRGPFLRVTVDGCAPIRTVAIGGGGIDCVGASALLRPTGRQDRGWLQVILADGRQGWVDGRLVGW